MKKIVIFLFALCTMMMGVSNVFAKNVKTIEYKTESIKYFDTAKRQVFYTDENYKYYFKANIGDYINVIYDDSTSETIIKAFEAGNVTLNDLTTYGIEFKKIEKELPINPHTDVGGDFVQKIYKDDSYVYFESCNGYVPLEMLRDDLNNKRLTISDLDIIGYGYFKALIKDIALMESYIGYLESTDTYKNLPKDYDKSIIYDNKLESFSIGLSEFHFKDGYILYKYNIPDYGENLELHQEIGDALITEIFKKLIKENNYKEEDLMFYDYEITTSYEKNGYEYKINEETGAIIEFKINLNKITLPIDEDAKVFSKFIGILEENLPDLLLSIGCSDDYCVQYGYEKAEGSKLYSGIFELHYKDGKINMVSSFGDEEDNLEFHEELLSKVHEALIKAYIEYHDLDNELLNNYKLSELSKLTLKDNGIEYKKNVSGENVEYSFKMNVLDEVRIPKVTYNCEKVNGKYYDSKGNEVDKKTYENVCGIDENPHTGEAISILGILGLGCLGIYIKKHSKKKIKYNI